MKLQWKWALVLAWLLTGWALASPRVLYSTRGDANNDGKVETIEVMTENPDPCQRAQRWVVVRQGERVLFQSARYNIRFHPEFDSRDSKAGVVLKKDPGQPYADIMVVLTPHSGDLMLLHFNGKTWEPVDVND